MEEYPLLTSNGTDLRNGLDHANFIVGSHHGNEKENIKQLLAFEKVQMDLLANLTNKLQNTEDSINGGTLLDNTLIVFASGMSNPSTHDNRNLPVMLLGGGINHCGYIKCPDKNRIPMSNLLLSVLHYLGINQDQFGRSKGTFDQLNLDRRQS